MFEDTLKLSLSILAILALVLVNGVFVAAEFAIVRVRRTRLEELAGLGTEAARRAIQLLLFVARPLQILHIVLRPIHRLFETLSTWILRRMGYGAVSQQPFTEDELKLVLMDSHEEGVITEGEVKIIIRAFEFADKRAEEIMIPAERVAYISLARVFEQNLVEAKKHMHARLPLCRAGLDSVEGVVSMKDAWPLLRIEESNAAFEWASRPPIKVPLDLSQDGILRLLQEGHGQMGVVRDRDDQKTLGIVTLEDVLESLVGDVREAPLLGGPSGNRRLNGSMANLRCATPVPGNS